MRILALAIAGLAVSVWGHPLPVAAQFCALLALAVACIAIHSANKRAGVLRQKVAELGEAWGKIQREQAGKREEQGQ